MNKSKRPVWLRPAAALILAVGLLTATAADALAGSKMLCANASWDCALTKVTKAK